MLETVIRFLEVLLVLPFKTLTAIMAGPRRRSWSEVSFTEQDGQKGRQGCLWRLLGTRRAASTDEVELRTIQYFQTCGHGGRYEYTALEADTTAHERMELERKARHQAENACLQYIGSCPRYSLLEHLNDIGSRVDKHWFIVRDGSIKTERLLTLVPKNANCPIQCDAETRQVILDLFLALQHPYIYPILDLEFREGVQGNQTFIVLVLPYNTKGSLKDLIYKSSWQADWCDKYGQRSEGLPISQVQRLGRQILEALHFLKERGFPCCSHLHSGNVILQNGVARLSGLENILFGFASRIHPILSSVARADPATTDVICFGHVMFEMCAGYELTTPQPTASNLVDIENYPQVLEVLDFIFHNPKCRYPSIEELLVCDFFRNIDLREMRATSLPQVYHPRLTSSTLALLNEVKKHQKNRRSRRSQSASVSDQSTPSPRLKDREPRLDEAERLDASRVEATIYKCPILASNDYSLACDEATKLNWETEVTTSDGESAGNESSNPDTPHDSDEDTNIDSSQEHRDLRLHIQHVSGSNDDSPERRRLLR